MGEVIYFAVGVLSTWAIGLLSRGGLSKNPARRMYLAVAAICGLVASTAGVLKDFVRESQFLTKGK
jgi:hypothetical protein